MQRSLKRKVVAGGIAALAVAGAGGAVAATQLSPKAESDAVLEDAAKELGVDPDELDDALRTALENRVDEAVKAGRLSEEEGKRLKEAIESGDFPMLGVPFFRGHGPGPGPASARAISTSSSAGSTTRPSTSGSPRRNCARSSPTARRSPRSRRRTTSRSTGSWTPS